MQARIDSLRRAVLFGIQNGKKNMIVDLDVLAVIFMELADKETHKPNEATFGGG